MQSTFSSFRDAPSLPLLAGALKGNDAVLGSSSDHLSTTLATPTDSSAASSAHPSQHSSNPADNPSRIPAYAKLEFAEGDFFIQTLSITIGRRPPSAVAAENPPAHQQHLPQQAHSPVKIEDVTTFGISPVLRPVSAERDRSAKDPPPSHPSEPSASSPPSSSIRPLSESARPNLPNVDLDLGAIKAVSRNHARLHYDYHSSSWALDIQGRNGAVVDGEWIAKGDRVYLKHRTRIQIAERIFHFVLPNMDDNAAESNTINTENLQGNLSDNSSEKTARIQTSDFDEPDDHNFEGYHSDEEKSKKGTKRAYRKRQKVSGSSSKPAKKSAKASAFAKYEDESDTDGPPAKKAKKAKQQQLKPKKKQLKPGEQTQGEIKDEHGISDSEPAAVDVAPAPVKRKYNKKKKEDLKREDMAGLDSGIGGASDATHDADIASTSSAKRKAKSKLNRQSTPPRPPASNDLNNGELEPDHVVTIEGGITGLTNPHQGKPGKPPLTYASLIAQALSDAPTKRFRVDEIYDWIKDKYPFYRDESNTGWQNSIRHNLSLNRAFVKTPHDGPDPTGILAKWSLDPEHSHLFDGVNFKKPKPVVYNGQSNIVSTGIEVPQPVPVSQPITSQPQPQAQSSLPQPHPPQQQISSSSQNAQNKSVPIVIAPIPDSYVRPTVPPTADDRTAALLKDPPIILHEGKLILNPTIFSHLTQEQLKNLQALGLNQAMQILQAYIVQYFKDQLKNQQAKKAPVPPPATSSSSSSLAQTSSSTTNTSNNNNNNNAPPTTSSTQRPLLTSLANAPLPQLSTTTTTSSSSNSSAPTAAPHH